MPFRAGPHCLRARRRALWAVSVAPPLAISAAVLFSLWPWQLAAAHVAAIAFLGVILAEFSVDGVQRIPFTCSYLPGKSNLHVSFWLWVFLVFMWIIGIAINERKVLQSARGTAALLVVLGMAAIFSVVRNNRGADPIYAELRFEEIPPDHLVKLGLS